MPGSPHDDAASPFDALIERLFAGGRDMLDRAAEAVIPRCNTCHERAVPVQCVICKEFACLQHGHYSVGRGTCVCDCCVSFMAEQIEVEDAPGQEARESAGWQKEWMKTAPKPNFPWGTLGVKKTASEAEIQVAFRAKALRMHPDIDHTPGAEARFKELNRAYRVACGIAAGMREKG